MINKHLIHKKSSSLVNGSAKLPIATDVEYGELAINYLKDNETISIKNSADEIVTFLTSKNNENKYVNVSGDTMTGALTIQTTLNVGSGNTASGLNSFAQGSRCTASGNNSHAEGYLTHASGDYSHAEGEATIASGQSSHAEGRETKASGYASHAEGSGTTASGQCSHAEGGYTTASGDYSHAEGEVTKANGWSSHAEGSGTTASGVGSHAEGLGTIANNNGEHASGSYNVSTLGVSQDLTDLLVDSSATLFSIGNGTSSAARKNVFEVKWNGDAQFNGDTKFAKGVTANTISATTMTATTFSGNATSANKVNSTLSFAAGAFTVKSFDGSAAVSVNVPTKTSDLTNDSNFVTTATDKYLTGVTGSANGTMTFARINETALTFDSKHVHPISEVTSLQASLDAKVDDSEYNTFVTSTNTALGTKLAITTYNTYTAATKTAIDGKAPSVHDHTIAQVTGLQTALDGKQAVGDYATNTALTDGLATKQATLVSGTNIKTINGNSLLGNGDIVLVTDISGKVDKTTYNAYVTATDTAIAGKAPLSHTHTIAQVIDLQGALDSKFATTGGIMTGSLSVQGTISASTQIYSSDITLKENIDLISDEDISVVRSLSPKAYMFKEDVERRVRYGVIAQDVESTKLDELVYSDEEGIKGIDYISYLVLKCEQLQRDLNVLQSKFGNI